MKLPVSILIVAACASALAATPVAPTPAPEPAVFHCQVPCGIYGDKLRIDMLMEDATTIEKGMKTLGELGAAGEKNYNQIVRWVSNKDHHAQQIQQTALDYWLAQRIKAPKEAADAAAADKYHSQLAHMHGVIVAAMKCKQTTDPANVEALRNHALQFSSSYFSAEDLKHVREHHGAGGR